MIYQAAIQFKNLLANCPSFQTWTGAADATAADVFSHFFRSNDVDDINQTKFIIIDNDINLAMSRRQTGTGVKAFERNDGLRFAIFGEYTYFNPANAAEFIQVADALIKDLCDLGGVGDYFKIDLLNQVEPLGVQPNEDAFRWDHGDRKGYQLHFSVSRTSR